MRHVKRSRSRNKNIAVTGDIFFANFDIKMTFYVIATSVTCLSTQCPTNFEIDLDLGSIFRRSRIDIPRKEVIHPQLPLRVPCYDFVPIIDPTFRRPTAAFGYYRLS